MPSAPSFVVRQYQPSDREQVVNLFVDGMREYPEQKDCLHVAGFIKESLETDLADVHGTYIAPGGNFWVVTTAGTPDVVVGSIGLEAKPDKEGELRRLNVHSGFRRFGLGRLLLSTLEQWAGANGFRKVWLTTGVVMGKARAFYEANGYKQGNEVEISATYTAVEFEKTIEPAQYWTGL